MTQARAIRRPIRRKGFAFFGYIPERSYSRGFVLSEVNAIEKDALETARRLLGDLFVLGRLLPLLPCLMLAAGAAQAIVVRHDTGYTRYEASEADYPAVFYLEKRGRRRVCVATLIRPRWAITAGHCTEQTPLREEIDAGRPYAVQIAGRQVRVDRIHVHPDYPRPQSGRGPDVDLALLRLDRVLEIPRPVPVYRGSAESGRILTLLGWGYSGNGIDGFEVDDGHLRFARNRVTRAGRRLRMQFDDPRELDSEAVPFEGFPALDDSGGPALLKIGERFHIAGVAVGEVLSSGQARARGRYGATAVYERLSLHRQWIDEVTGGDAAPPAPGNCSGVSELC